jgi:streptogramin lyase
MARGSDGNLWFTTTLPYGIGRITPTGVITLFPDPNNGCVGEVTSGPDGNIWFLESESPPLCNTPITRIGRITPAGVITEFTIPPFLGNRDVINQLIVGPDGNLWFTSLTFVARKVSNGFIGRVTPAGVVTEFGTPTPVSYPEAIAFGSDGNLWFTEAGAKAIGRITPAGQVTEFPMAPGCASPCSPNSMLVRGSDGNLWFTTSFPNGIGRVTPTGQITVFPDPNSGCIGAITSGPDGNVWFYEDQAPTLCNSPITRIDRITPAGVITAFPLPAFQGNRDAINQFAVGPDGNLWFTSLTFVARTVSNGFIGRVTPAGVVTEFGTPTPVSYPEAIAAGSDNNLWFTEAGAKAIGRITTQ